MKELEIKFSKANRPIGNRTLSASFSIDAINDIRHMWFDQAEYDRQLLNKKLDVLIFDADPFDINEYPALQKQNSLIDILGNELQDEMDKEILTELKNKKY